jgi:phospholipid/cholesterol/gamma-HCH transport system permease protein
MENVRWLVWTSDIRKGLFKAAVFGFILSSIACYKGYHAKGGAKGVGEATTEAVVASLLAILIVDFFITYVQMM